MNILFFKTPTCSACKRMPFVNGRDDVKVINAHDADSRALVTEYDIHSVPTTIVLQDGVEVARHIGAMSESDFNDLVREDVTIN